MKTYAIFSTKEQLGEIARILSSYIRLPLSTDTIPGALMEGLLAHVRGGVVKPTYDFVDVVNADLKCGWQIKSTKASTPVTWKRAKIRDAENLIKASRRNKAGCQKLGDGIIDFCNAHAKESIELYDLNEIGYCRLIVHEDGLVTYFERLLCTREAPILFNKRDFTWRWSKPKKTKKKEQLPALHGTHTASKKKWFAWHGLGENQLHFSGEKTWWPEAADSHAVTFKFPGEEDRIGLESFVEFLSKLKR